MRRWAPPLITLVALIGIWQLAASTGLLADVLNLQSFLVPSPADIASSLWNDRSLLADQSWVTYREVLLGLGIAIVVGVAFAVAMHLSETIRRAFYPLIIASQTVPTIVIAPILVIWFGYGIGPKLAIIALVCFFSVTVNTLDGLRATDSELPKLLRTLDANRWQILMRVEAPTALPYFFSGTKIAVAVALIGAVFGEWAGSSSGLGHLILQDQAQLQTNRVFAAVVLLAAFAMLLFGVLALLERRVAWWGKRK
jgi:NitT/TauT family transport system permease protein/putative hydroxymethylpyrimidine transport system permease protein